MITGRHELHLTDEKMAIFHAEAGNQVRLDVPLVGVVHESHDVRWLWRDRIPLGRVTLIEGEARSGKSFVALDLAARASGGVAWPDSPQAAPGGDNAQPLQGCLLVSLQDNPADTLGRRLQVAGGDPNRLLFFSRFLSTDLKKRQNIRAARFPGDLPAIEYVLDQHAGVRLIVIDPLSDFCATPGLLAETIHRLNGLAAEREIAVVVTLRASGRFDSRGRLEVKSRWPTDAARCAWFVAIDPGDDSRRLFVPTRTNFCVEPHGLGFWIEAGRIVWNVAARIDFQDPLQNLSGAALWLSQLLAEGDVPAKVIFSLGAERGYTPDMLRYAGNKIGALKQRIGGREDAHWKWSLQVLEVTPERAQAGHVPHDRPAQLLEHSEDKTS
ncbi:MAG TPA: AAA family ATPase [Planctomycetaceae bacterium]|jgi:hypothetical protein